MIDIPLEARCPHHILHDFKNWIDNDDVVVDICQNCGKKLIFNKVGGRIDTKCYYESHFLDFLQPYGSQKELYTRIYGSANPKLMAEHLEKKRQAAKTDLAKGARDYMQELRKNRTTFSI